MTTIASPFTVDLGSDDEWMPWPGGRPPLLSRSTSINSYGVTVIGRGNSYSTNRIPSEEPEDEESIGGGGSSSTISQPAQEAVAPLASSIPRSFDSDRLHRPTPSRATSSYLSVPKKTVGTMMAPPSQPVASRPSVLTAGLLSQSPVSSPVIGSRPASPILPRTPLSGFRTPNISRPGTPGRTRRRSSQQRVSLIAGRLALIPNEPVVNPDAPQRLVRSGSTRSFLSVASSVGPPARDEDEDFSTGKSLSEFVIEREIGRGAYGLVKRAREMDENGKTGVRRSLLLLLLFCLYALQLAHSFVVVRCVHSHPLSSSRSSSHAYSLIAGNATPSTAQYRLKFT
jgi:protein-serine/threonine kinase